jgi:hypothetical protein
MDKRPLFYESAPHIREVMEQIGQDHSGQLGEWLARLETLGADRNEKLSTLAHLAAIACDEALKMLGLTLSDIDFDIAKGVPRHQAAHAAEALRIFMGDVMMRAVTLDTLRAMDRDLRAARDG